MRKFSGFLAVLLWISPLSTVATTVSGQQELLTADREAYFDAISAGESLRSISEDGLRFSMQGRAGLIAAFGSDLRKTGLLYGDGGNNSWLTVSSEDNALIQNLSLLLGSGWNNANARYLQWRSSREGNVLSSGELVFRDGETALFSDLAGFDTLEIAAFTTSGRTFGDYQALAVDDVKAQLFSAVPLPASAWFFLSALLGLIAKRRITRD